MDCSAVKAAFYIRVSTEEQASEGQSVDAQIETLTQYCKLYNIEIYDIYRDLGVSGKSSRNRPGLQLMLRDASKGKFNMVLVWKISRLSRSLKDLLLILEQLEKNNIVFTSYSEKFDTSNPVGRMTLQLLGSIAEFERNTIIDNVKLGLREYARKGGKTGTILGYDSVNRQLTVNPKEAEIVKLIYKLYVINRMSMGNIADFLNSKGYLTKREKSFRKDGISVILSNPAYIGINRHNIGSYEEYHTKGAHPSIIDSEIWEAAQELRQSNKHIRTLNCDNTGFFLTNKLICKGCGSSMAGFSTNAASRTYRYYKCKGCGRLISAAAIEATVSDILQRLLQSDAVIKDTLHYINRQSLFSSNEYQLEQIKAQISSCSTQLDKYVALLTIDDLGGSQTIVDKIKGIEEKLRQLHKLKDKLQFEGKVKENSLTVEDYNNIINSIFNNKNKKVLRQILDCAVKFIEIDKDNHKGYISYNFNSGSAVYYNFEL